MPRIPFFCRWPSLLGVGFLLMLLLAWAAWRGLRPDVPAQAEDPRLTFDTPFRNVRPEVKYVGSKVCASCHPAQAATYQQHSMGQSLAPISEAVAVERFNPESHNPFEASGFDFVVERRNAKLFHKEVRRDPHGQAKAEFEAEVHYVIGSGARARSYLIEREGFLFESAITWYSQKGTWDLSPGFAANPHSDRPITAECLFCHCNHAEAIEDTINRYRPPIFEGYAIGCERCHGPGELHAQLREREETITDKDDTIVNPGRLSPALREAVCEQCHLQGEIRILHAGRKPFEYRPGLPWDLFWTVFVKSPDSSDNLQAVGQVEQMHASRCYLAELVNPQAVALGHRPSLAGSRTQRGNLGCISCHDPHALPEPAAKVAYYRRRCLSCHTEASCNRPPATRVGQNDDCVGCHMPKMLSADVAHTAITDHRILRQPSGSHHPKAPGLVSEDIPLGAFPPERFDLENREFSRDLGLALTRLAESGSSDRPARMRLTRAAMDFLDVAVKTFPRDVPAWQARGYALWQQNRKEEAQAAFETALNLTPEREATLVYAASLAAEMGQHPSAVAYWQRALTINPWAGRYHFEVARLLLLSQEWQKATEEAKIVLRLNPFHFEARKLLVVCYQQMGDKRRAAAEFDRLLELNPPNPESLRRWFDQPR